MRDRRKPERKKPEEKKEEAQFVVKGSARKAKAEPKIIATHTVTDKDTLSHVSLKYYGNATRPYWMVIFEANKDVLGDEPPGKFYPGVEVKIPELPEELKKK